MNDQLAMCDVRISSPNGIPSIHAAFFVFFNLPKKNNSADIMICSYESWWTEQISKDGQPLGNWFHQHGMYLRIKSFNTESNVYFLHYVVVFLCFFFLLLFDCLYMQSYLYCVCEMYDGLLLTRCRETHPFRIKCNKHNLWNNVIYITFHHLCQRRDDGL